MDAIVIVIFDRETLDPQFPSSAMFSLLSSAGNKMMETFQGFGYSDEGSRLLKQLELASKNFRESKLSVSSSSSSERRTRTTGMKKPDDPCRRCSSDSSPLVINKTCGHKFCVNCILYLWSRQKLREPCICPLDGEKMTWLRPAMLHEPEEISSLVDVYNPLFNPKTPDMLETQLEISLTWLYCVDMVFATMGSIAYYIKFCNT